MITLTYYSKTKLDINTAIAEQWRENVTQQSAYQPGVGTVWRVDIQVQPEDSSYRYRALMQKPQLVLKFNLPFYFEFPVGTSCIFQNQRFILTRAQDLKKQGTRKIEYTMTLGTNEDFFGVWKIRNVVDPLKEGAPKDNRLKFSLCAKPHEFIDLIVRNLNKKDTSVTWERGECIEASEKTVEFNHTFIDAGLTDICNVFQTEYEVEYIGTTRAKIHLRRVEYFKTEPVALSYGVGNGFIPGVGRTSEADGVPVKRMLVQGSDRNIDRAKYGSPELLLPKSQTIRYDGTHFEDEDGFNSAIARTYKSNADGDGVERIDKVSDAVKEDSIDCSEIYPSRVGEVTAVEVENEAKNFYNIIDSTIPDNLNYNNYMIAGETMTIIFQDGMLAGKEFDVYYKHEQRKFEIVPQEIDGVIMPDKTWCPVKEQTYAIFGIQLPDEYICNNTNKSGGSWDMMRAAVKALYECEDQRFTFTGSLQSLWAKRHWLEVGGKLVVGGHVLFQDEQFAKDGVVIRIVGIKDFLTSPYSPTIELSNSVSGGSSVSSQIRQITNTEVVIDDTKRDILQFTKRRFRDAKETIEMLEDAQLDMFTNAISPIAVQAMSLLIGDESLQFQFVSKSGDIWTKRATPVYWDNEKKQLLCTMTSGGLDIYLQHLTIGHNAITSKSQNDAQGYMTWSMNSYTSPVLTDASAKYYLYAKCPKDTNSQGEFVLTQTSIKLDAVANHYHFLVGLLNAEIDGERSFVAMHGFTEVSPGRITTDRIVSSDGKTFFDLANSIIGGKIDFQDGLVSGLIGIGNENGINAGMSGSGNSDEDVRFWAGAPTEDAKKAPFRVTDDGSTYQTKGEIGKLKIDDDGLHYGDVNDWSTEELKTQIRAGRIRLQNKLGYNLFRLGLGDKAEEDDDDTCFFYLFKQYAYNGPNNIKDFFKPAIKLDCRWGSTPNVALLSYGSIVAQRGGILDAGYIMDVSEELPLVSMYRVDIQNGTIQVLKNTSGQERTVYLDFENEFLPWILNTHNFAIKLTIVAHKNNTGSIKLVDFSNNKNVVSLGAGGIQKCLIVRSSTDYSQYYIVMNNNL